MAKHANIVLDYPVRIERTIGEGDDEVLFARSCEFFLDEHGLQWIKFVALNGYSKGKEHMIRTDSVGFTVIRDEYDEGAKLS
jgi:hypothetical protein